jgi:membrane AbrB-like protein
VLAASLVTRCTGISLATSRIGLMPGGASVSVAMSDEIGTDARLVAVMQYLRVYLILVTLPFVSSWIHTGPAHPGASPQAQDPLSPWLGAAILVASLLVTFPLMKVVRLPSGFLLFPLLITAVVTSVYTAHSAVIPDWLLSVALQAIGLLVGLQFTVESLRQARNALAVIVAAMVAIVAVCAGFGFLLSAVLGRSFLDGYLATTPGGVNVILGVVTSGHADATFVTAAQVLRIVAMLIVVPLLGSSRSRDVRSG